MSQSEHEFCALSIIPTSLGFTVKRMYNDGTETVVDRWLVGNDVDLAERLRELHVNPTYTPPSPGVDDAPRIITH